MGGFFDFLLGKHKLKPHEVLRRISEELSQLPGGNNIQRTTPVSLEISDEDCNRVENYLAAACAGTTANVYIKKQPKLEEIERCLAVAKSTDLLVHMSRKVFLLQPETRRILSAIWGYMLKLEDSKSFQRPMVEYLGKHTEAIESLLSTYGNNVTGADITIGIMIRDATRFQKIVSFILKSELVFSLFSVLTSKNFDVSADAFQTLKDILTNHKEVSGPWLSQNFKKFFTEYMKLLSRENTQSSNNNHVDYVIARQSLSILATILLDRQFMDAMLQFVSNENYLKDILVLLSNPSKVVQFEAFHIFKIFAANPKKPPKVAKLLQMNSDRIVRILSLIEQERLDDLEFRQDKAAVMSKLEALRPPAQDSSTSRPTNNPA